MRLTKEMPLSSVRTILIELRAKMATLRGVPKTLKPRLYAMKNETRCSVIICKCTLILLIFESI